MEKNHRQGRQGAGARTLQRAHARRLLLTLANICRELRRKQKSRVVRAAYLGVERDLLTLTRKQESAASAAPRGKRKS
jgi:hypothetical protein